MKMHQATVECDDTMLVSRREWLRLTALVGAAAGPAAIAQQLSAKTTDGAKGNVNRTAALWLAVTTGQNWTDKSKTFTWDTGFITTIPKDMNPAVGDVFAQVKGIVEGDRSSFTSVVTAWNNLTEQLLYPHPDVRPGILALANKKP
jgi:hypothetical protein